jgi:exodeoxyribonuclease VII large subunit
MSGPHVWSVGDLTRHIRNLLEADPPLQNIWLRGEISNLTLASSGHLYFVLKDASAALKCVMWRSGVELLAWRPEQGAQVLARGRVSVYAQGGVYQFYVEELHPAGLGDLHARFEELRERLREEGLFRPERKRPLPAFPRLLGVVTSPQAAALADVLHALRRRFPLVKVLLAPTLVQGDLAPAQIVAALQALSDRDDVEAILLVRGGGSLEELWAFNDERVARAIVACRHPVVSGVGHDTDLTIADLAADVRASTPTAAAEMAVPDQAELRRRIRAHAGRLEAHVLRRLAEARQGLERPRRSLGRLSPQVQIEAGRQRLDELLRRAAQATLHRLALQRAALQRAQAQMVALSPLATLERGYAIVRREDTGGVVRSIGQVRPGDGLRIQVQDGELTAVTKGMMDDRRH